MTDMTTGLFAALALAADAAVVFSGVPRRRGLSPLAVVRRDKLVVGVAALTLGALLLGAFGSTGAWLLLALTLAVAAPVASDRRRRTNGDLSPLLLLRTRLQQASAGATTGGGAAGRLRKQLDVLPGKLRKQLAAASDRQRMETICRRLADSALRSGRDGEPIWLADDAAAVAVRDALIALASAHPATRERALVGKP